MTIKPVNKLYIRLLLCSLHLLPVQVCMAQKGNTDQINSSTQINLPDSILATLNPGHPRLLVKSLKDFDDLKNRISTDDFLQKENIQLQQQADKILTEDVVKYELANQLGGQLLEVSRKLYRRIYILALNYRLTHNKKYADRAWKELLAASQFPDWNPWHFLDVSEMTHGFAIGYDWLYDVWTPEQRKIIKQAIVEKALLPAYQGYTGMEYKHLVDWPKANSNWNQVCSGGIGMGALAIADEEPLLCNYILRQALFHLPRTMNKLEPDGASEEGPGYWKFGTSYNVVLLQSLVTALGTDFGLSKLNGFSKTGEYYLSMASPTGTNFNYADCWGDTVQAAELFWFAKKYNQPLLAKYQIKHPEYTPLEMLYYYGKVSEAKDLPLNNYFRGAEVATMRTSWSDPKAWFIGFKAGHNQANHGHLDIGSFVLNKNGKRWAVDLGHDSYALPGYFDVVDGQRWTYYRMKAEGHNTLVIDPDHNPDQNPKADCKIERFVGSSTSPYGIMDITDAYSGKVKSAKRGILLQDNKRAIIEDEITVNKPIKDLYWFMQTPAAISISENKKTAILTIDNEQLKVELASPTIATFEVLDAKPLPASIQPLGGESNDNIKRLTIHLKNTKSTTIAVVFKEMNDKTSTVLLPLAKWQ